MAHGLGRGSPTGPRALMQGSKRREPCCSRPKVAGAWIEIRIDDLDPRRHLIILRGVFIFKLKMQE